MLYLEKTFTDTHLDIPANNWNEPIEALLQKHLYFLEILWDKDYAIENWKKLRVEAIQAEANMICHTKGKEVHIRYTDFLPGNENLFFPNMNYVFSLILKHTNLFHKCVYGNELNEVIWPIIPFVDPIMGKSIVSMGKWYSNRQIQFIPYSEYKNWNKKIYTKSDEERSSFCDRYVIFTPK